MTVINPVQFQDARQRLALALCRTLRPTPHLLVSDIAREHLHLSPEYSKVTGRVNLDLYPYLREPMDRLTPDDPTRTVVFCGPIQGGKTMIGQAFLAAVVTHYPGPMLWVTSHDSKAEDFSKTRLDLMIRDSPLMRRLVADEKSRDKNNTIKLKRFPGGTIKLVGAQSVSGLTSDTIRFVVIDEADDHRENVSGAGSSIALAMGRQTSFGDMAKTLIVSSPKTAGASDVDEWARRGTDRRFEVACPACGTMQVMDPCDSDLKNWRLVWPKGDYSDVHYECSNPDCGAHWHENDKPRLLSSGKWSAPTNPNPDTSIESYRLNFLYLPLGLYSWERFARDWDNAVDRMKAGDMDELRSVINTRMARPFEDRGEGFDPRTISERLEPDWGAVPDAVQLITMATDVQGGESGQSRFETMWVGWGEGGEGWLLDYDVSYGELDQPEIWQRHDELRARTFDMRNGSRVCASVCFIDRGFEAQKVLAHTMRRAKYRTYAIKGVEGTAADAIITAVASRTNLRKVKNAPYYQVRTTAAKDAASAMLRITQPGPKFLHISDRLLAKIPNLLDMLASEQRHKVKGRDGKTRVHWDKKIESAPNEAWDLLCYCLAGRVFCELSGFRFRSLTQKVTAAEPEPERIDIDAVVDAASKTPEILSKPTPTVLLEPRAARQTRPKSGWLTGGRSR